MNYYVLNTEQEAEDLQRYIHYHTAILPMYNRYVPDEISAEEVQAMYESDSLFLSCSIDQCWDQGYNRVLGYKGGQVQTDFQGVTTDYDNPRPTQAGKYAIAEYTGDTVLDLASFNFELLEDDGSLFPEA